MAGYTGFSCEVETDEQLKQRLGCKPFQRLGCNKSDGIRNWRCTVDCDFWDGKKCFCYEGEGDDE